MGNNSISESEVVVHHNNQTLWPEVLLENISSSDDSLLNTSSDFGLGHFSEGSALYRHSLPITIVYCLGYVIVFVLGLIGNCFVVAVVYRTPRMKTVTNYFIVNLAVADVLVVLFCLPATLLSNIFVPWVLGEVMCKLVAYVQGVSVVASVESLIAVSLDRVLAICFPMRFHITTRLARLMIVVIWFLAMTSTIPWPLFFNLVFIPLTVEETSNSHHIQNGGDKAAVCLETWPTEFAGHVYFVVANLIFCYLLPLLLITICYVMIWLRVWRRSIPTDSKDPQMERIQQRSKVKVVKMLVIVVIIFSLSWLPLYAIFTRIKLGGEIEPWEEKVLAIATPIAQWLGSSNSCINPILYAFFNKKYRNGFKAIIKSRSCCGTLRIDENRCSTVSRTVTYPLHKIAVRYAPESKSVPTVELQKNPNTCYPE